jgi:hypothetical protein
MFKRLLLSVFLVSAVPAHAAETHFACQTEESANKIGATIVENVEKGGEMAEAMVMLGECTYFDEKDTVYVVHRGATFGKVLKVTVVGLSHKTGEIPEMWGLILTDQLDDDGTI